MAKRKNPLEAPAPEKKQILNASVTADTKAWVVRKARRIGRRGHPGLVIDRLVNQAKLEGQ